MYSVRPLTVSRSRRVASHRARETAGRPKHGTRCRKPRIAPDASRGHDQGGVGLMGFTPTGSDAIVVAERPDSTSVTRTPWHCARQWRCHAKARITWTSLPTVAKRSPRASSPGSWSSGTSRARRSSRPSRSRRQAACPRMSRPSTLGNPRGVADRDRHLDRTDRKSVV